MATRKYDYNGYNYWITTEPAINQLTKEIGIIAYINNEPPGGLLYGALVRDEKGRVIFFENEFVAFTYVNDLKQNELKSTKKEK